MLTQTLRILERDGLVHRKIHASVPPRVEYSLTPLGRRLTAVIAQLREWAYEHMTRSSRPGPTTTPASPTQRVR